MIATLSELKTYLWITDSSQDTLLNIFLSWADQFIKTYTWRDIEATSYTEYEDWDAQNEILLSNYPVNTLTSISRNTWSLDIPIWTLVETSIYKLSSKIWKVFFSCPIYRWFQNYKIIYNAWYTTIPWDLKLACLKLASTSYNTRVADWIKSESVNQDRLDYDVSEIPNDILVILNAYRDINV